MWKWLSSLYRKLVWVVDLVFKYVKPIYDELVPIIKAVGSTDLSDEEKRREVFKRISEFIKKQLPNLVISDSILNIIIELVYQLVKQGRA